MLINHPFLIATTIDAKFHYLEYLCIQNKELGEVNAWSLALIGVQYYYFQMELKAFGRINCVILLHILNIHKKN